MTEIDKMMAKKQQNTMATGTRNEFRPDYATHPGETLEETLQAMGMSKTELARRMGRSKVEISRIVSGKVDVTPETALQLGASVERTASLWEWSTVPP